MIVYFTASTVGKKQYQDHYQRIIDLLKTSGCEVILDHIMRLSRQQVIMESREERLAFHKKLEGWIKKVISWSLKPRFRVLVLATKSPSQFITINQRSFCTPMGPVNQRFLSITLQKK